MELMKLRGYVKPEDMNVREEEKIQKAIDLAVELDIRKVILDGTYELTETVKVPAQIEIVLKKDTTVTMTGCGPAFMNAVAFEPEKNKWSFEDDRLYFKGEEGAKIIGTLSFYHAGYVVIENLAIEGSVEFEFTREVRMERDVITGEDAAIVLGRGCNNYIMQYFTASARDAAVVLDPRIERGEYVVGKDAEIHEIILKDAELNAATAVKVGATAEFGVFNCQIDHIKTTGNGITIGDGEGIPKERFFNITATDFTTDKTAVVKKNETKHCWFGE